MSSRPAAVALMTLQLRADPRAAEDLAVASDLGQTVAVDGPRDDEGPGGAGALPWAIQDSNLGPLPYQRSALTD
jgi:hypothetical protein